MNLIGSRANGWWRDRPGARRALVAELAAFAVREAGSPDQPAPGRGATGHEASGQGVSAPGTVAVVFDGRPAPDEMDAGRLAGIEVSFAPGGPNAADRVIAAMVRDLADPAGTTVVTSDAALAAQVRSAGAAVMGVGAFGRLLHP